jgi:hypothetical protein
MEEVVVNSEVQFDWVEAAATAIQTWNDATGWDVCE